MSVKLLYVYAISLIFYLFFIGLAKSISLSYPTDWDSLHYHIAIATQFVKNGNLVPQAYPLYFYPAWAHLPLTPFIILDSPTWLPNLFNLFTLIPLGCILYALGKQKHLTAVWSLVFTTTVLTLTPILRLLHTQIVDLWVLIYFLSGYYYVHQPLSYKNTLLSALFFGLFTGSKFTALPIMILTACFYHHLFGRRLYRHPGSFLVFLLVGGFWYGRNFLLTGNALYPAGTPFMASLNRQTPLLDLIQHPTLTSVFINGLISEFHIWLIAFLILLVRYRTKVSILGFMIMLQYLITPAFLNNIVHDLRYTLPGVVLLILVFFISNVKRNSTLLLLLFFIHSLTAVSFFGYVPKAALLTLTLAWICTSTPFFSKLVSRTS